LLFKNIKIKEEKIVMAGNMGISNHTFHNGTTSVGNGVQYNIIGQENTIILQFITSGTFAAVVEAKLVDSNSWYAWDVYKKPSYDSVASITDKIYAYEIDVTGTTAIRVRLTAVSGALTCYGRVVG
jgi:hypothetical protein